MKDRVFRSLALLVSLLVMMPFMVSAEGTSETKESKTDNYPNNVIKVVVPFGAGGANDVLARIAARYAEKYIGTTLVVENFPGGGQVTGQREAFQRPADGYTILATNPGIIQNPILKKGLPYTYKDWDSIIMFNREPEILAVRSDSPIRNVTDFIAASKTTSLTVAIPGALTNPHICGMYFEKQTGAKLKYVYGDSGAEEVMQLLGGHVDSVINTIGAVYSAVKEGKVRIIGVMDEEVPALIKEVSPDAGTFVSQGYDVTYWAWRGFSVKKGTPPEVVNKLSVAFKKAAEDPEFQKAFKDAGYEASYLGGKDLAAYMDSQNAYMSALLQDVAN